MLSLLLFQVAVTRVVLPALATAVDDYRVSRPGIWSWACGYAAYQGAHPAGFRVNECFDQVLHAPPPPWLRGWFHVIYWNQLEPEQGVFDWAEFDKNLTLAAGNGLQLNPVIYIFDGGNPMPRWMANVSEPVLFHRGGRTGRLEQAPNYLDPAFQVCLSACLPVYLSATRLRRRLLRLLLRVRLLLRLLRLLLLRLISGTLCRPAFQNAWQSVIREFARHVSELPAKVKQNIWAAQAVAGITGDNRPWNGAATCFLRHYILKPEDLPRQARDTHGKS